MADKIETKLKKMKTKWKKSYEYQHPSYSKSPNKYKQHHNLYELCLYSNFQAYTSVHIHIHFIVACHNGLNTKKKKKWYTTTPILGAWHNENLSIGHSVSVKSIK